MTPKEGVMDAAFLNEIAQSIGGKTRKDAEKLLNGLVKQGRLGAFELPEVETLPAAEELEVKEVKQ
jgi:hypothetical protein